jgi:hypothetical protein
LLGHPRRNPPHRAEAEEEAPMTDAKRFAKGSPERTTLLTTRVVTVGATLLAAIDERDAEIARLRGALAWCAIPLEALRASEMGGKALAPEMKRAIMDATERIRTALARTEKGGA